MSIKYQKDFSLPYAGVNRVSSLETLLSEQLRLKGWEKENEMGKERGKGKE